MRDLDRAALEAFQLRRLLELRQEVVPANKFQSPRLAGGFATLAEFKAQVPFTFKQELVNDQIANAPCGTNLTYAAADYTRFCQTSSTTGSPLRWLDTAESWDWMIRCWIRVFQESGVGAGDRIFFTFSFGPFLGFWVAFDAASRMGCMAIPGGGMSSTARLGLLASTGATVLCCTPTYAIRLAEVAREEGVDVRALPLRTVVVAGEPGGSVPGTRALLETLWPGARIVDHHGMTETGPVSYECPKRAGVLHIIESEFIAEVVDPSTGKAVPDGESGELVLTNLGRTGSPILRYRTGDLVQPAPAGACACGSHELALIGGILARRDDMVVIRGVNVYPSAVEDVIRACGGIAEYRAEIATVRSMVEIRLYVEPLPSAAEGLQHRLESALRDALGMRIPVNIVGEGALPRFEMKAKRWVRI
ncbi:MAG: AMP-binding protein [Acidobacteria bacterium]|nr:AMP-binding protein [Acidobacteriota bacterium]